MKVIEAEKMVCPFMSTVAIGDNGYEVECDRKCITKECMFWKTTVDGLKEVDRKTEPYDMTPMSIRDWSRNMISDGYENIGRDGGFRDVYVKYEEAYEGYCKKAEK